MNGNGNGRASSWRRLFAGSTSATFRRVFVLGLTVVSLGVWTVTVIGMGVLRSGPDGGSPMEAVAASLVPEKREITVTQLAEPEQQPVVAAAGMPLVAMVEAAPRDPFLPDKKYFPEPQSLPPTDAPGKLEPRDHEGSNTSGGGAKQLSLVPLRLEATLLLGGDNVAIVMGNAISVDSQTWMLQATETSGQYRVGDEQVKVEEMRSHFRTGSVIDVRLVVKTGGGYSVDEKAEAKKLLIRKITDKSVVLTLGDKEYELEMKE